MKVLQRQLKIYWIVYDYIMYIMLRLLALSLCLNSLSLFNVLSANEIGINFPKQILYKIIDDKDRYRGLCTLRFSKRGTKRTEYKTYTLTLSDFEGLGFSSNDIRLVPN